ncbi:MAG TPA: guanylate kinase [Candidatus Faecivivens stercorigallinarum]|nr:guanylate kinase [Candidatus Faecivivens stercorigallinarum]
MSKGILLVLSGPSGSGKGTILGEYSKDHPLYFSVSNTTRAPRPGEIDGVHYHFISREEFENKIAAGGMLEYAQYCDNYYGTPRDKVEEQTAKGVNVMLDIETQGAMNVRAACPEAVLCFVVPPSMEVLRHRLTRRGTEDEKTVNKRLAQALNEIRLIDRYDFVVINDALEDAVADFAEIVAISQAAASGTLSPEQQTQLTQMKEKSAALKAAVKKEFLL